MSSRPVAPDRASHLDEKRELVERVIQHPILHGSEALCHLLRYLADHSLERPQQPLKEHQIATEVFGRPATFDPRIDSTVRVQTSRLRAKLAEYYSLSASSDDAWQIEIPKGSYSVLFHERVRTAPAVSPTGHAVSVQPHWPFFLALVACAAALTALVVTVVRSPVHAPVLARPDQSVAQFWHAVLPTPDPPLLVYSNAEFVGRPETGLRYFQPDRDPASDVFDQYTGVGEVMAIHQMDELFALLGRHVLLKRGRLLNWDDTKNRDLIFIGSPSENLPVRELPANKDFVFRRVPASPRPHDLAIVNLNPRVGEQAAYFGSKELPMTEDYALIQFSAGALASRRMLLLAGTTTFGTQGAVEFVCRPEKLAALLARFGPTHTVVPFSALLHVRIQGGVPLDSDIIAFRMG